MTSNTSGTSTFNPALTFIITSMYRKLGVITEDETPTAGMLTDAKFAANSLIKEWMNSGLHVWTEEEAIVFLQPGQARYLLGLNASGGLSPDHSSAADAWVLARLSSSAAASATSLVMVAAVGIVSGQNIGVVLDSGLTFWTTVDGTPIGTTVTITDPLPSSASAQNFAYVYTTPIIRPLKVPTARRLAYQGLLETPMGLYSRQQYMDLPNKYNPGTPTQFFYSPKLNQGEFYIWPVPQDSFNAARITWYRPLEDFNNSANTADLPQEWINTLTWNLAKEVGLDFDVPANRWAIIIKMAEEKLEAAQNWDRESEPVLFGLGYPEIQR